MPNSVSAIISDSFCNVERSRDRKIVPSSTPRKIALPRKISLQQIPRVLGVGFGLGLGYGKIFREAIFQKATVRVP